MPKNPRKAPKSGPATLQKGASTPREAPVALSRQVDSGEFAIRQSWQSLSALSVLPNPDPILRKEGKSLSIYRQMIDGHLLSVSGKRRAAVRARPWMIESAKASSSVTESINEIFSHLPILDLTNVILDSRFLGYSVLEVIWGLRDGLVVPERIIEKPQEWFGWNADGSFRFMDDSTLGVTVPERKFLVARNAPSFLNPYGLPLLSACFWPLAFKRGGLKFWMTFSEKYGMPRAIGKVPASTSYEDQQALLTQLEGMVRDAVAVIPDNASVELQEASGRSSSVEAYTALIKWADSEMSKSILGETLTTETQGNSGSRALGQVHAEVRADLALDDAAMVEGVYNQLITWICELNFPGDAVAPRFQIQMPEDLKEGRVARDSKLRQMGLRFTPAYYSDTYGIDPKYIDGVDTKAAPAAGQDLAFAEGEGWRPDALAEAIAGKITAHDTKSIQQELAGNILELAEQAGSFDEFSALLETRFPTLPTPVLEEVSQGFALLGDLAGRDDAQAIVNRKTA